MGIMDSISSSLGFGGGSSNNVAYNDVSSNNNETSFLGSAVNGIKEDSNPVLQIQLEDGN